MYRCGHATLVFVHYHKGGGTTFVAMAKANGAGLPAASRNGDPVQFRRGPRDEWWTKSASDQWAWFQRLRHQGTRFISTEKGFPAPDRLLAPAGIVYAVVVREPVSRFVSYYFWRYRDKSVGSKAKAYAIDSLGLDRGIAALRPGAPSFAKFVEDSAPLDGYYVRRILGKNETADVTNVDLDRAVYTLRHTFSLVLVTDKLSQLDPVVRASLGWTRSSFDASRRKANPKPDVHHLLQWRPDWHDAIATKMPLDSRFYAQAADISGLQLAKARLQLHAEANRDPFRGATVDDDTPNGGALP